MKISLANWAEHQDLLMAIRRRVFIDEQGVPEELEWDEQDASAVHLVAMEDDQPAGCLRILPDGRIGRMAVLLQYRRHSIGTHLLYAAEQYIEHALQLTVMRANVQTQAYRFYQQNGFFPETDFNLDAGIVHLGMKKTLPATDSLSSALIPAEDNRHYSFPNLFSANGLLQIAAQYRLTDIVLLIPDLRHPNWSDAATLSCLTAFLRYSNRRHIRILLGSEYAGIADHPLMQWQQRLSSRVHLHVHSEVKRQLILLKPYGYIDVQRDRVVACLNDRARVVKELTAFTELWRTSAPSREGRRLKI